MVLGWKRGIGAFLLAFMAFSKSAVQGNEPIVFEVMGQEPYAFTNNRGELDGYFYHVANRLLEKAGYPARAVPIPLKRLVRNLRSKATHCTFFATRDFSDYDLFAVDDIGHTIKVGIVPKHDITLKSYDDLRAIRIGTPIGMRFGAWFDDAQDLQKIETPNYAHSSRMLYHNRIDAIAGVVESIHFSAAVTLETQENIFGRPYLIRETLISLICHNDIPSQMRERLSTALKALKESGEIKGIIATSLHIEKSE